MNERTAEIRDLGLLSAAVVLGVTLSFEFSLIGLVGLLPTDNHGAILLGFSPKIAAWK